MAEQRLPIVDSDEGIWGTVLNQYIKKEHYDTGADNAANGGHQNITIRSGTISLAPLTFANSASKLSTPVAGAVEFYNNRFYLTQATNITSQKVVAVYDDAAGAAGDIFYRDANANLVRLPIGGNNYTLTSNGSSPTWSAPSGSGLTQQQVMAINSMRI